MVAQVFRESHSLPCFNRVMYLAKRRGLNTDVLQCNSNLRHPRPSIQKKTKLIAQFLQCILAIYS